MDVFTITHFHTTNYYAGPAGLQGHLKTQDGIFLGKKMKLHIYIRDGKGNVNVRGGQHGRALHPTVKLCRFVQTSPEKILDNFFRTYKKTFFL